jgi:hypothetical protein
MLHKLARIILAVGLAVTLAGCGGGNSNQQPNEPPASVPSY